MQSENQLEIIKNSKLAVIFSNTERVEEIAEKASAEHLDDAELIEFLEISNLLYRNGVPLISDNAYGSIFLAELEKRHPNHPYLQAVEQEKAFIGKTVTLPQRMLSTEKAYTKESIHKWLIFSVGIRL